MSKTSSALIEFNRFEVVTRTWIICKTRIPDDVPSVDTSVETY